MKPYFSVIIPARNAADTLDRAMQSVLSQDFRAIELIVSVNASTDGTGEVAARQAAADGRVRVYESDKEGVSAARNIGVEAASGRYVLFCDADDYYLPGALGLLREALRDREWDFLAAFFDGKDTADSGALVPVRTEALYRAFLDKPAYAASASRLLTPRNVSLYRSGAIAYRRSFLRENGIRFDPSCRVLEDIVFNGACLRNALSAALLDRRLYHYTVREGSLSRRMDLAYVRDAAEALTVLIREHGDGTRGGAYLYFRILVRMGIACAASGDRECLRFLDGFIRREEIRHALLHADSRGMTGHPGTDLVLKTALYALREGRTEEAVQVFKVLAPPVGHTEE